MVVEYADLSATNSAIGLYGLVERRADGFLDRVQATTLTLVGVAAAQYAANAGGTIAYYPIENLVMLAQVDDATVNAQTDFDLVYDIVTGAPNATTGRSIDEIDGSSQAATATLPIKILKVHAVIGEANALGANVKVECIANQGVFKGAGTTG